VADADSIDVIVRLSKVLEIVLTDIGLTMNQFRLLTLVQEGSPSAAELSLRLVMKPPNVSVVTAGLVNRGLIEQGKQAADGRRRTLALTSSGRALLADAHDRCAQTLRFLEAATPGGLELMKALEGWLPALEQAAVGLLAEAEQMSVAEDDSSSN
jgi:DNA-binding MarR family transcriptional regulator